MSLTARPRPKLEDVDEEKNETLIMLEGMVRVQNNVMPLRQTQVYGTGWDLPKEGACQTAFNHLSQLRTASMKISL